MFGCSVEIVPHKEDDNLMRICMFLLVAAGVQILPTATWGGGSEEHWEKASPQQYLVRNTGVLCVTAPCPSYGATNEVTGEQHILNDVIFRLETPFKARERFSNREVCLRVRGNIRELPHKTLWISEVLGVIGTNTPVGRCR